MVVVNKETIEANVSALILNVIEKDWTNGKSAEYVHLQEDLEECVTSCLLAHHIHIKQEKMK